MGKGDGEIYYRDGIAIAQVILFSVSAFIAIYFRLTRRICWSTLAGFSIVRCVGAGCMLGTINRDTKGLWAGVFVCESLGMLLIIFTFWEMMEKIDKTARILPKRIFWIPQVLMWIDIAISVAGFIIVSKKEHGQLRPTPYSRAGIAILFFIYVYTTCVLAYLWLKRQSFADSREDMMLAVCMGVCVPLIFVRILYSLIFVASGSMVWSPVKGNPTAYLCMTMGPEVVFMAVLCFAVWRTAPGSGETVADGVVKEEEMGRRSSSEGPK